MKVHINLNEFVVFMSETEGLDELKAKVEAWIPVGLIPPGEKLQEALVTLIKGKANAYGMYPIGIIDWEGSVLVFCAESGYPMSAVPMMIAHCEAQLLALGIDPDDYEVIDHTDPANTESPTALQAIYDAVYPRPVLESIRSEENEDGKTCPECDSENLVDFDMMERDEPDGTITRFGTFRCADCGFPHHP